MIYVQGAKDPALTQLRTASLLTALRERRLMTIMIEAASNCNLVCTFCDLHAKKEEFGSLMKPRQVMRYEVFEKVIDDLRRLHFRFRELSLHAHGEPLLNKRIVDMAALAIEAKVSDRVLLSSNGLLMTPDVFDRLAGTGIDEIVISLDTVDPDRYRRIKGKDMGDLIAHIDHAIANTKRFPRLHFVVKCMKPAGIYGPEMSDYQSVMDKYGDVATDSEQIHIKVIPEFTWQPSSMNEGKVVDHRPCELPFYQMLVHSDGTVSCCCIDITKSLMVGDTATQSIPEILESPRWREIRRILLSGCLDELPSCRSCNNRTVTDLDRHVTEVAEILAFDQ